MDNLDNFIILCAAFYSISGHSNKNAREQFQRTNDRFNIILCRLLDFLFFLFFFILSIIVFFNFPPILNWSAFIIWLCLWILNFYLRYQIRESEKAEEREEFKKRLVDLMNKKKPK